MSPSFPRGWGKLDPIECRSQLSIGLRWWPWTQQMCIKAELRRCGWDWLLWQICYKDDNSSNAQVTKRGASSKMRTESTYHRTMNNLSSCESGSCRKILKWSYKSGDLWDTGTLIAGVDVISSMASSADRSTEFFTRGSSIFGSVLGSSTTTGSILAALSGSSSCSNSAITSDPGSSRTSGSTRAEGSVSVSLFAAWLTTNFF